MAPIQKTTAATTARVNTDVKTTAPVKTAAPAADKPAGATGFDTSKKKLVKLTGTAKNPAFVPKTTDFDASLARTRKIAEAGIQMLEQGMVKLAADLNKTTISEPSKGFNSKSASGKISAAQWADPTQLVGKLTQTPAAGKTPQSQAACSAANLLGAALLSGGPDVAAKVLEKIAAGPNQLTDVEKGQLNDIAKKVANKTATFEDLNKAQELSYRSANFEATGKDMVDMASSAKKPDGSPALSEPEKKKLEKLTKEYVNGGDFADPTEVNKLLTKAFGVPTDISTSGGGTLGSTEVSENRRGSDTSGLTDYELQKLGTQAVGDKAVAVSQQEPDLDKLTADLKPGEAVTLRVAGDDKDKTTPNHYVTIGRQKNGQLYIYNPDPSKGDSTLVTAGKVPDEKFNAQLAKYEGRMKTDRIENVVNGEKTVAFVQPDALKTQY